MFEKRWDRLSESEAANPELRDRFRRDLVLLWLSAVSLPLVITGAFLGVRALGLF